MSKTVNLKTASLSSLILMADGTVKTPEQKEELACLQRYYGVKHPADVNRLGWKHKGELRRKLIALIMA